MNGSSNLCCVKRDAKYPAPSVAAGCLGWEQMAPEKSQGLLPTLTTLLLETNNCGEGFMDGYKTMCNAYNL